MLSLARQPYCQAAVTAHCPILTISEDLAVESERLMQQVHAPHRTTSADQGEESQSACD